MLSKSILILKKNHLIVLIFIMKDKIMKDKKNQKINLNMYFDVKKKYFDVKKNFGCKKNILIEKIKNYLQKKKYLR